MSDSEISNYNDSAYNPPLPVPEYNQQYTRELEVRATEGESEDEFFNEIEAPVVSSTAHIERKHNSEGYLVGIAKSKSAYLQRGFDYGYTHGAQMGIVVGKILGVLQARQSLELSCAEKQGIDADSINAYSSAARGNLSPGELFGKKFYEKESLSLPKALFPSNNSNKKPGLIDPENEETYHASDDIQGVEFIEDFLKLPFSGNPAQHPSLESYQKLLD